VTFGHPSKLSSIGDWAFVECKLLQRLHIVASVSAIAKAFVGGSGVREITFDSGNPHFLIVDDFLMEGDSVVLYFGREREVFVPSHVTVLKNRSFYGRVALEAVRFEGESQLRSIEEYAFSSCLRVVRLQSRSAINWNGRLRCNVPDIHQPSRKSFV
jgi:hypothetical protein